MQHLLLQGSIYIDDAKSHPVCGEGQLRVKFVILKTAFKLWQMEAVIFIGIQGSGKSTFYREKFLDTHVRINLDMLKTRQREKLLLQACFTGQQRFVVDNTNATEKSRAAYMVAAKAAGFRVIGYYFNTKLNDALQRNRSRKGKVIPVPGVIATYKRLELPKLTEGFDQLFYVSINDRNEFVVQEWNELTAS